MRTRTENDVKRFNEAIAKCTRPVWLVSSEGTSYNMKSTEDYYAGMGRWVKDSNDEMEIFTCSYEDEEVMLQFLQQMHAA